MENRRRNCLNMNIFHLVAGWPLLPYACGLFSMETGWGTAVAGSVISPKPQFVGTVMIFRGNGIFKRWILVKEVSHWGAISKGTLGSPHPPPASFCFLSLLSAAMPLDTVCCATTGPHDMDRNFWSWGTVSFSSFKADYIGCFIALTGSFLTAKSFTFPMILLWRRKKSKYLRLFYFV